MMKMLILCTKMENEKRNTKKLNSWDEEADEKVTHTDWAIKNEAKRIIFLSNHSDNLIFLLGYINGFMQSGSKELWLQYGTRESRCMIPLHMVPWTFCRMKCDILGTKNQK